VNSYQFIVQDLTRVANQLSLKGTTWYLFGSVSRGELGGDVDLLIVHEDSYLGELADIHDKIDASFPPGPLHIQLMSRSEEYDLDFVQTEFASRFWSFPVADSCRSHPAQVGQAPGGCSKATER
jgi:hypothetical protein